MKEETCMNCNSKFDINFSGCFCPKCYLETEMKDELKHNRQLLIESLETLKWMFEHMAVVDQNLQSDAFNLPANAITNLENYLQIHKEI